MLRPATSVSLLVNLSVPNCVGVCTIFEGNREDSQSQAAGPTSNGVNRSSNLTL